MIGNPDTGLQIPQQDFSAGVAVAVRLMMIQFNLIIPAHIVQPVADIRKQFSSDLNGAKV